MNSTPIALYPLKMRGIYQPTLWGGQRLRDLGKRDLPAAPIGEVWETSDDSRIANGTWAGRRLVEAMREWGVDLLGERSNNANRFPLLVKLIDAHQTLSVQVHPNDTQAAALEGEPWGKTEAWHILKADPGAEIVLGTRDCDDLATLREHITAGTLQHRLNHLSVSEGDTVYIPAGRIHALGRGLVAYEVQQQSNVTYRLYDWDRRDAAGQSRELHVDKGLQVATLDYEPLGVQPPLMAWGGAHFHETVLVASPYFALKKLELHRSYLKQRGDGQSFVIHTVIAGEGMISWGEGEQQSEPMAAGDTFIVPARLGEYKLTATPPGMQLLRAYVPPKEGLVQCWPPIVVGVGRAGALHQGVWGEASSG